MFMQDAAKQSGEDRCQAEAAYRRALNAILAQMEREAGAAATPAEMLAVYARWQNSQSLSELCEKAVRRMATGLNTSQARTWRQAAAASTRGREIAGALRENLQYEVGAAINDIVLANAGLIRSVPRETAQRLSEIAKEGFLQGKRPDAILSEMKRQAPKLTENHARLIARTESSKASTALTEARAQALGLSWYAWETAQDGERVRDSHRLMQGVLCRWDNPPNPEALAGEGRTYGAYHPGGIFNCRCIALPVFSLEDVAFPVKVHVSGQIVRIPNLQAFRARFA